MSGTAEQKQKQKKVVGLPAGFEALDLNSFGEKVEWKKDKVVAGEIVDLHEFQYKNKIQQVMSIATDNGLVNVFKSAGLKNLFAVAKPGYGVWIKFVKEIKFKGSHNPMKVFEAGLRKK